jgi:hypothetical protein
VPKLPARRAEEPTPLQALTAPTSPQAAMQTGKQANLITFSARGVDRDIALQVRIYATATEQNIGTIVTAALREYMARHDG